MGKTSSKTTKPWAAAQPYVLGAAQNAQQTYNDNQPNLQAVSSTLSGGLPGVAAKAFGTDPTIQAAQGYTQDVLGGKYLNSNPYTDGMLNTTNQDVTNSVNSVFGASGRTGSDAHMYGLSRGLADADNNIMFGNYNAERQAQGQAAGQAGSLYGAEFAGITPTSMLADSAAQTPYLGSKFLSGSTANLLSPYTTQTSTPSTASSIKDGIGTALQIASVFSDRRLKKKVRKIGEYADGLGKYAWEYTFGGKGEGVMADEVARLRPWALGPKVMGYATVDYGAL